MDYREADLTDVQMKLCHFAIQLTCHPGSVQQNDIDSLREAGLSDRQIGIAIQVISYFNYINRIADGVDVESETFMAKQITKQKWLAEKPNLRTSN